jgi:hypothetical protein
MQQFLSLANKKINMKNLGKDIFKTVEMKIICATTLLALITVILCETFPQIAIYIP